MVYNTYLIMTDPIKHLNKVSGRRFFSLTTLSQREGERMEVRRKGRSVQFAISSPSHYNRFVKMYINTLNVWTIYEKFNSVSNINNKDIKWVCRVIYNTHTHTHTHTHTQLSDKENEETEQEV